MSHLYDAYSPGARHALWAMTVHENHYGHLVVWGACTECEWTAESLSPLFKVKGHTCRYTACQDLQEA